MKKKFFVTIIMILMLNSVVLGYSEGFEYMLNSLDIERQNINGHFINEDIYKRYNLLVYGNPLLITKNQRWKETPNGNWSKNTGVWNGNGIRGEYWILRRKLFWKRST